MGFNSGFKGLICGWGKNGKGMAYSNMGF